MNDTPQSGTISLLEEELHLGKTEVVTDHVHVRTSVEHRNLVIEDSLLRGDLSIERVAVELMVTASPEPRYEGDTLIVSVVEERLVIEKRLFVVEELRIARTSSSVPVSISETVRVMHATVERTPTSSTTGNESDG